MAAPLIDAGHTQLLLAAVLAIAAIVLTVLICVLILSVIV
jgi:hypothetical protein